MSTDSSDVDVADTDVQPGFVFSHHHTEHLKKLAPPIFHRALEFDDLQFKDFGPPPDLPPRNPETGKGWR